MSFLDPADDEIMAFYRVHLAEVEQASDVLMCPEYSRDTLRELTKILGDQQTARLVLAWVRLGDYGDEISHWCRSRSATQILIKKGVRMPKGKRPRVGALEFINIAAPMLINFGLRPSSSERSRLVAALRVIADGLGIPCDPREAIRRQKRLDRERRQFLGKILFRAMAEALRPSQK